jgi:hypothetical protein
MQHGDCSKTTLRWNLAALLFFLLGFSYIVGAYYYYCQFDLVGLASPMLEKLKTLDSEQLPAFAKNLEDVFDGLNAVIRGILFLVLGCLIYACVLFSQLIKVCGQCSKRGANSAASGGGLLE